MHYGRSDIDFIPYSHLNLAQARLVEDYCHTLDPTQDSGETPYGWRSTLAWIHYQNFLVPVKRACAPFGTLTAWCKHSRSFVGMASIVTDDRGVRERYHLGGNGMWGGVIVPAHMRRRGIGRALVSELDARCQAHAEHEISEACFLLITDNPAAEMMYIKMGFTCIRSVTMAPEDYDAAPEECRLLQKVYIPQAILPKRIDVEDPVDLCIAALHGSDAAFARCLEYAGSEDPLAALYLRVMRVPQSLACDAGSEDASMRWLHPDGPVIKVCSTIQSIEPRQTAVMPLTTRDAALSFCGWS